MTRQRPDQAIWPIGHGDVPARAPGRAPAVTPVHPAGGVSTPAHAAIPHSDRPRTSRARLVAMILAVLLAGAGLGTGFASWFAPTSSESPRDRSTKDAEGPFAERQASVNRSHIPTKQLAEFAAPWLDRMGDCTGDTQSGGPERGDGEQRRTRCTAGIATVYWISYRSIADRDAAQARYADQAAQSQHLAPGMLQPSPAAADHAPQLHVEYAYQVPAGRHAGQTVAALWWSDPAQPVAGVLTAYWEEGLGSSWAPLRDLWRNTS